tara:strand:- start:367 stop:1116 length:750 start_codon:yes stop_codon:yes gene_type:complete
MKNIEKFNISELEKDFQKNGFCIIKNLFNRSEIRKISNEINIYIKSNLKKFKPNEINFVNNKPNSVHNFNNSKYLTALSSHRSIMIIAEHILQSKVKLKAMEYFAKPRKIGLPSPAHQDNFYWCLKKNLGVVMWISLNQSSKKNGSVYYYKGSHKLGLLDHEPSYAPGSSQKVTAKGIKKIKNVRRCFVSLEPGDCLVHHCLVVHGSEKNRSTMDRKGFVMQFVSSTDTVDQNKLYNYRKSLEKQISIR